MVLMEDYDLLFEMKWIIVLDYVGSFFSGSIKSHGLCCTGSCIYWFGSVFEGFDHVIRMLNIAAVDLDHISIEPYFLVHFFGFFVRNAIFLIDFVS